MTKTKRWEFATVNLEENKDKINKQTLNTKP